MDKEDVFGSTIQVVYSTSSQGNACSPKKNKKTQPLETTSNLTNKGRGASTQLPYSPLRKEKTGSNCAMLDSFIIGNSSSSEKSTKQESKLSTMSVDDSPDSGDSTEENEGKQGPSLASAAGPQFISHQTMFSNGSYASIWPHPIYQNFMNLPAQGTSFPGITPLAPPLMGGPHLAASWLASLHNFTVLDQQRGGIDLLVTNLDESVSKKELKKKLASVFREHCKVHVRLCQIIQPNFIAFSFSLSVLFLCTNSIIYHCTCKMTFKFLIIVVKLIGHMSNGSRWSRQSSLNYIVCLVFLPHHNLQN